jgi:hypothetical protein
MANIRDHSAVGRMLLFTQLNFELFEHLLCGGKRLFTKCDFQRYEVQQTAAAKTCPLSPFLAKCIRPLNPKTEHPDNRRSLKGQ